MPDRLSQLRESLMQKRAVMLGLPIDDAEAQDVIARFKFLESQPTDLPITLLINSPGGSVTAGLAILDTMESLRVEVHTHCLGQAHSLAAIILAVGAPGHRAAAQNCVITFSKVTSGGVITPGKAAEHERITALLIDKVSRLTYMKPPEIKELFAASTLLTAENAVALGVIDKVIPQRVAEQ